MTSPILVYKLPFFLFFLQNKHCLDLFIAGQYLTTFIDEAVRKNKRCKELGSLSAECDALFIGRNWVFGHGATFAGMNRAADTHAASGPNGSKGHRGSSGEWFRFLDEL